MAFSPNGQYVAGAVDNRLVVRDAETLQVVQLFSCIDKIQRLEWARNSVFLLCCCYKKGLVQARAGPCKFQAPPASLDGRRR